MNSERGRDHGELAAALRAKAQRAEQDPEYRAALEQAAREALDGDACPLCDDACPCAGIG